MSPQQLSHREAVRLGLTTGVGLLAGGLRLLARGRMPDAAMRQRIERQFDAL
ncbi:MAG: hypothetical protein HYS05_00565 [Acidobacteria bacterium]|nr:hypothetical protein [Acidobacteriota bacterium]